MKNTTPLKTVLGIDLGDKKHAICVLNQDGTIREEFSIYNRTDDLEELAAALRPCGPRWRDAHPYLGSASPFSKYPNYSPRVHASGSYLSPLPGLLHH